MKKVVRILSAFVLALVLLVGFNSKAKAASWGARHLYTTPKATRGVWYYREGRHIKRWVITAHTSNGHRLYKVLPSKQYAKWENKLEHLRGRRATRTFNYLDRHIWQAATFKWHGITSFNSNAWLAGAGSGIAYTPVKRTRKGRRVRALRFGGGAGCWLSFYAYKSRSLAR